MRDRTILSYDSNPTLGFCHRWMRIGFGLAVAALAIACTRFSCEQLYWYPSTSIRGLLESVPGVHKVHVNSYDDPPGLKVLYVVVTLNGVGHRTICLGSPKRSELRRGTHIRIDSIGPYELGMKDARGEPCWWIDVGTDGPFSNLLPFQLHDVEDLVRRYDDVLAVIEKLPPSSTHPSKDGNEYQLNIRKKDK